jgi:hypothetical protein
VDELLRRARQSAAADAALIQPDPVAPAGASPAPGPASTLDAPLIDPPAGGPARRPERAAPEPAAAAPSAAEAPASSARPPAGPASAAAAGAASATVTVVPGIGRYHRAECILIRFLGEEDLEVITKEAAEAAGSVPCKACRPD